MLLAPRPPLLSCQAMQYQQDMTLPPLQPVKWLSPWTPNIGRRSEKTKRTSVEHSLGTLQVRHRLGNGVDFEARTTKLSLRTASQVAVSNTR